MIELNRKALLSALDPCGAIANTRSTMAILGNVLCRVAGGKLSYRATNLRQEVCGEIAAAGSGAFAVGARDLYASLASLDGETVSLKLDKSSLTVKGSGRRSFKLQVVDADEFPSPMAVTGQKVELEAGVLPELIRATLFTASTETNVRAHLCVVRLEGRNGKLTAAATDGVSLAMTWVESPAEFAISIPTDTAKLLIDAKGPVLLQDGRSALSFTVGDGPTFSCAQPDGSFPPLDVVSANLPTAAGRVTVSAKRLLDSLKALRKQTDDMRLRFTPEAIELHSFDRESESDDAIEVSCPVAEECWIPGSVVASALSVLGDGEVELAYGGAEKAPLWLRAGNWTGIVMARMPEFVKSKAA